VVPAHGQSPLNARELEVLRLVADGLSNREIAQRLIMSPGTIKWYTSQIYSKLQVRGRTQALARARELRLLD
jgi:LuxR family maltose regulon positive regulatory protein